MGSTRARAGRALLALLLGIMLAWLASALLSRRRTSRPAEPAPAEPAPADPAPADAAPADDADGLMRLTRDELYARARARQIPGRSRMTKRQLAEALTRPG